MNNFIPVVNHSLKYNSSIDGLRGTAIFLVLLFHIWPEYFSFGYVGVDIFFVLSGYLITQIIYTKIESNSFCYREFYRNRIRRIFPALIVVLISTFLIGYLFMFPTELEQLGKHIKSSVFFYENFRLIGEVGYWDESATLKPLLHFWSLAIEEQFYIFWPLILVILYKIRFNFLYSLSLVFLILFVFSILLEVDKFYHTIARAWELCFGGLTFLLSSKYNIFFKRMNKYSLLIYVFFVLAIALSFQNTNFDTLKTLFIVITSGFLITLLSMKNENLFFSNKFLVFIGLISFPLYLWHYTLISYVHIFGIEINLKIGLLLIVVSILLSYLTYRYIEFYARRQNSYKFVIILFLIAISLGIFGNFVSKTKGLENRKHLLTNEKFEKQFIRTAPQNELGISLLTKILGYTPTNNYIKSTSDDITKKYILVMGDSHAHTSYPGFAEEFKKYGYETILLSNSSCPEYLDGAMGKTIQYIKECEKKINTAYEVINSNLNIKKIIFTSRMGYMYDIGFGVVDNNGKPWNYHYEGFFNNINGYNQKNEFFNVVERTFSFFEKNTNIDFYYLMENPELGFSPKNCVERPFSIFEIDCKLPLNTYINRSKEYREFIYELSNKYKNIHILDPKNFYCDDKYCYAVRNNKMLYADDNHHSVDGSLEQAKFFIYSIISKDIHSDK